MKNHPKKAIIVLILSVFMFWYIPSLIFDALMYDQVKLWEYLCGLIGNLTVFAALYLVHKQIIFISLFVFLISRFLYVLSMYHYIVDLKWALFIEFVIPSVIFAIFVCIYYLIGFIQNKRFKYNKPNAV